MSSATRIGQVLQHPMARGMITYSVLWPTGTLVQQTFYGKPGESYDWAKCARFSAYGSLFVAPTLYAWVRFAGQLLPSRTLRSAMAKAAVEQITYGPAATAMFFFAMSYAESGGNAARARAEVAEKFLPTFKVGACFWPFISTINFAFVPERNRILFTGICSLIWTTFLAYMKQLHDEQNCTETANAAASHKAIAIDS